MTFKKAFISAVAVLITVLACVAPIICVSAAAEPETTDARLIGDVNNDGDVNINDATLIQKVVTGKIAKPEGYDVYADANGDKKVDVLDVTTIQKYLIGIYDKLPTKEEEPSSTTEPGTISPTDSDGWGNKIYRP